MSIANDVYRATREGLNERIMELEAGEDQVKEISLRVKPEEMAVLRFALDHALASISEAHPEDRAALQALIERLAAAEKAVRP